MERCFDSGWEILRRLPRSKISVTADKIIVSAIADSLEEKRAVTEFLNQEKTRGIMIETHITSPREVIAPFVFRLNLSDGRAQLDICSADSETAQMRILQGLEKFDMITPPVCDVGLGVPTPDWADVVLSSLDALYNMGAGVVTMTDFNIRFVASSDVDEGHFERVVARLRDMLETADYPVSEKWSVALTLGGEILRRLPRSKISVTADKIIVSAIADSLEEKRAVTEFLNQEKTRGIMIETHITSPREVIAPFVFRLNLSDGRAQLDICSADSETAQMRILQGLEKFDMITPPVCDVGLGVPTPDWADVVLSSLDALYNMGAGVVTMTDFNIRFVASSDVDEGHFERVVARLRGYAGNCRLPRQ